MYSSTIPVLVSNIPVRYLYCTGSVLVPYRYSTSTVPVRTVLVLYGTYGIGITPVRTVLVLAGTHRVVLFEYNPAYLYSRTGTVTSRPGAYTGTVVRRWFGDTAPVDTTAPPRLPRRLPATQNGMRKHARENESSDERTVVTGVDCILFPDSLPCLYHIL